MGSFPTTIWLRSLSMCVALLCCAMLSACAPDVAPDLLEVQQLSPPALETGVDLRVDGSGFPEHRPGQLTFSGTVYSPGRAPRAVEWDLDVHPETRSLIRTRLSSQQLGELLAGAQHGTFRGTLQLSFAPLVEGRPTLRGSMKGVVLDAFYGPAPGVASPPDFANFLGLELSEELLVRSVQTDSAAAQAGLTVGDRLTSLDNVRLDGLADFVPAPHARTSEIVVQRVANNALHELKTSTHIVERASFQVLDTSFTLQWIAACLGLALALLWVSHPPRFLLWLLRPDTTRRPRLTWIEGTGRLAPSMAGTGFVLVCCLLFWLQYAEPAWLMPFDFVLLVGLGSLLLLLSAFLLGGQSQRRRFSLLGALASSVSALFALLPITVAAICRASELGSLHLKELADGQGIWPLQWGLCSSPWAFLLSLSFLVGLVPIAGRRAPLLAAHGPQSAIALWGRGLEWLGSLLLLGLWLHLFGGGLLLEGHSFSLAALVLVFKLGALTVLLSWIRARSGHVRLGEVWALWGARNLVLSLLALLGFLFSLSVDPALLHMHALTAFSSTLVLALLLFGGISAARSWAHSGRSSDPWI